MSKATNKTNIAPVVIAIGSAFLFALLTGFRRGTGEVGPVLYGYNPDVFSRYYTISDVEKSATAQAKGIDNTAPDRALENASILAQLILDPLTDYLGAKLQINSWFRSIELNNAVGGSNNSDHLYALAADIENPRGNNAELANLLLQHDIPFDQLIYYDSISNPSRLHVSIDPGVSAMQQQREVWLKANGKYTKVNLSS